MNYIVLLAVAAGGACGATARYLVTSFVGHWAGHGFPWGTATVNIVGSFILGALIELMALHWSANEAIRAFLVVGMLGAFTTFSTFSLDIHTLMVRGTITHAAVYLFGSVVLGLMGLIAGMALLRHIAG